MIELPAEPAGLRELSHYRAAISEVQVRVTVLNASRFKKSFERIRNKPYYSQSQTHRDCSKRFEQLLHMLDAEDSSTFLAVP
jgi:hypothetical protein